MTIHLQRQIEQLKKMTRELGVLVDRSVSDAIRAVRDRDIELAHAVIERDSEIDQMEVDIEEECLHTLALHQPVAFDLRYVVAVLKINNDLERIADLATNIAELAEFLADESAPDIVPYDFDGMAERVMRMMGKALDALVHVDTEAALAVLAADDEVDEIHRSMYTHVEKAIREHPDDTPQMIQLMNLSRHLERIADLTCNIAEDVLYMARGDIMRHKRAPTSS